MGLIVYGTSTCVDCIRSKRFLDAHAIDYRFIDIATDAVGAQKVLEINNGMSITPTIIFEDGSSLSEPSDKLLAEKLGISS